MVKTSDLPTAISIDENFHFVGVTNPASSPTTQNLPASVMNAYNGIINVLDYGADNTGTTSVDNGPLFEAALAELSTTRGGRIVIPPGEYNFDTPVIIPAFSGQSHVHFDGWGALLTTDDAIKIFDRTPSDNTNALAIIGARFNFEGITFEGNNTSGQVGLYINATYGTRITDCHFKNLDIGVDLAFALMTRIENCFGTNNETGFINLTDGVGKWSGATFANSQSNHSTILQCRDFAKLAASYSFRIHSSSGCRIANSISEGANVVNAVVFDYGNSTVVKDFRCEGLHCENNPTNSVYRIRAGGGVINIDGLYTATADFLADCAESLQGIFNFRNMGIVSSFTYLIRTPPANGSIINFYDCGQNVDLLDPALWESGLPTASEAYHQEGIGEKRGNQIVIGSIDPSNYANPIMYHRHHVWSQRDNEIDIGRNETLNRFRHLHLSGDVHASIKRLSASDLTDIASLANTDGSKRESYMVWDSTNTRLLFASGSAASAAWVDADGNTVHTPS